VANLRKNDSIMYLTVTDQRNHRISNIIGQPYADAANPINDFSFSLDQIFTKVITFDYLKSYFEKGVKVTNRKIYELAKRENPKYVLWRAHDYQLLVSTFRAIRDLGCIIIAWFWDDHFRFQDFARFYISSLDYSVTCDPDAINKYKKLGARCIYIQGGCAGEYYKKLDIPNKYDVSFVGTNVWDRDVIIKQIRTCGIAVNTLGQGWNSGKISFHKMLNIFNSSKINLNLSRVGSQKILQIKSRIFEIAMCGGFVMTEYVPGIERFFEFNKEIVCFESVKEAVNKIRYYLENDKEREEIANAGWKRAQRNYNWTKMIPKVFENIEKDIEINGRSNILPENPNIPMNARLAASFFHYNWAKAWFIENQMKLCRDELEISLKYAPNNFEARSLLLISKLPSFIQPGLFHVINKQTNLFRKIKKKLRIRSMSKSIIKWLQL